MSTETPQPGTGPRSRCGTISKHELLVFTAVLLTLESIYFADALRPGFVLSAADWLLATESFREPGRPDYEPANRLLTDVACQMEPWMDLAAHEWQAGRVPLWNPYSGCGSPLLANAQSGVFYPTNFIYFLTRSPHAWVAMAMVKLFIAGIGAFLLASQLGLGRLGRWFVGLCFPFSGFIIVWLQYPMGGVAVWLPTVLWLVERLMQRPCTGRAASLALVLAVMHLGGHPETAAHILVVAGLLVLWRACAGCRVQSTVHRVLSTVHRVLSTGYRKPNTSTNAGAIRGVSFNAMMARFGWFAAAVAIGFLIAAVQLVPTAEYLRHSQALTERSAETRSPLEIRKPQLLAMPALALPYVYGSYLRGHPHVEKALGVENFNEIAGGYTGLATIAVLVPLAFRTRGRHRWIWFWLTVDLFALAATYRLPVVDNLLRLIPVLNVTQNQRLLLVVALAHCLLGGAALDAWPELADSASRRFRWLIAGMLVVGAVAMAGAAIGVRQAGPAIERRAAAHFEQQARLRGLPAEALQHRATEMATQAMRFFPRYYFGIAAYAVILAAGVAGARRMMILARMPVGILVVCLADLFLFGRNYNPAIPIDRYFPESPVTRFLKEPSGRDLEPFRVLSLEEEFPANVLARYGIADIRNYDAIEVRRSLEFFEPLWPEEHGRHTSNSWTTWERVRASDEILRLANVRYVISTTPPDSATGDAVIGRVRIVPLADEGSLLTAPGEGPLGTGQGHLITVAIKDYRPGHLDAVVTIPDGRSTLVFSETFMPGWRAWIDGAACEMSPYRGTFMAVPILPGEHRVEFDYAPRSLRLGLFLSAAGLFAVLVLCGIGFKRCKPSS